LVSTAPCGTTTRLCFIADRATQEALALDALRTAADLLKKGDNTRVYAQVIDRIAGRLAGP